MNEWDFFDFLGLLLHLKIHKKQYTDHKQSDVINKR